MALEPLITRAQLSARISPTALGRCCDDSGQGDADDDAVARALADASSKIRGKLGPTLKVDELDPAVATEVVRIGLDIAHAYLAIRHPEVMRQDGFKMMQLADKDLCQIRIGEADLGTEEGEDMKQGARVRSKDTDREW